MSAALHHSVRNRLPAAAQLAAYAIARQPLDLNGRQAVAGYAIDSADPSTPMDRDDAIGIEYRDDPILGRLTLLHITIADVASVMPRAADNENDAKLAALDRSAASNGETLYYAHGISPMLPRRMQDRLSLEHGKERAGMTLTVTLDEHSHIVHTQFSRRRIGAHCKSYREAAADCQVNGHPIQQLSLVARKFIERKRGGGELPHYDPATGTYMDSEGQVRHISPAELNAYVTVQGAMIAANEGAATVMQGSNFLFRNHSVVPRGDSVAVHARNELKGHPRLLHNKAEYAVSSKGHFGLDLPFYAHVTSPIRRYADVVNQRMMHWAIDTLEAMADSVPAEAPHGREAVLHHLWSHAPELLSAATRAHEAGAAARQSARAALGHAIAHAMQPFPGTKIRLFTADCVQRAMALRPPYTRKQLEKSARQLNETLETNKQHRRRHAFLETESWLQAVFPDTDAVKLREWQAQSFSRLLEAAARRGDNNDIFAAEAHARLLEDETTRVANLYILLVIAERHKDSHWRELKDAAFAMLKADPQLAGQVFEYMTSQRHQEVYLLEATLLDQKRQPVPTALVVLSHDGQHFSAPYLDTGHTQQEARQAALRTFFAQYGSLSPHSEMYTPRLIEMTLARAKARKGERMQVLQQICDDNDLQTEHAVSETSDLSTTLSVRSQTGETISRRRSGHPERTLDKLARDLLNSTQFIDMLARQPPAQSETQEISGLTKSTDLTFTDRVIDRFSPNR